MNVVRVVEIVGLNSRNHQRHTTGALLFERLQMSTRKWQASGRQSGTGVLREVTLVYRGIPYTVWVG